MKTFKLLLFILIIISNKSLFAQWSQNLQDDDTITVQSGVQKDHVMVPDGKDGAIVVWDDTRNTNSDIYAQRIDNHGRLKWNATDIAVDTASGDQYFPVEINDGNYGVTIGWLDATDHHYYLQRIDSSSNLKWNSAGVQVPFLTDAIYHYNMSMCNGNSHRTIVALEYDQIFNWSHIEVNCIDANGNFLWGDGIKLDSTEESRAPQIVSDGDGGAIVIWWTYMASTDVLYALRIDSDGNRVWSHKVNLSGTTSNSYPDFNVISDENGGATLVWNSYSGSGDIYAQHINEAGTVSMGPNGVVVCNAANEQVSPRVTLATNGKYICSWSDLRNGDWHYIYAQKFDTTGNMKWTNNGILISDLWTYIPYQNLQADLDKGAYITWLAKSTGDITLFSQHITTDGLLTWLEPIQVPTDVHIPFYNHGTIVTSDSAMICSFETYQGATSGDLFVKKITKAGDYGCTMAAPTISLDGHDLIASVAITYQWFVDGSKISGATNQTFTPTEDGDYSVEVSDGYGCNEISSPYAFILSGVENFSSQSISLHPNPCDDYFILTGNKESSSISISISDVTGKVLMIKNEVGIIQTHKIELSGLQSGVFIVTVRKNDEIFNMRLVKR